MINKRNKMAKDKQPQRKDLSQQPSKTESRKAKTSSLPELRNRARTQNKTQQSSQYKLGSISSKSRYLTATSSRINQSENEPEENTTSCCDKLRNCLDSTRVFRKSMTLDETTLGTLKNSGGGQETGGDDEGNAGDPIIVLTYSQTLHRSMRALWLPINWMGRIPFKLEIERNRATIKMQKKSVHYVVCAIGAAIMWFLLLWFSVGAMMMLFKKDPGYNISSEKDLEFLEYRISLRYWIDLLYFWTTLFQATFATTHILVFGKAYASFVREWYKVLDLSKTQISKSLRNFIIIHWFLLLLLVIFMVVLFFLPTHFPAMIRTCQMITAIFLKPLIHTDHKRDSSGKFYFETYAFIGLWIYIVVVVFSWFSIIMYLVFCRCFRNALKLLNQRIRMLLIPMEEPRIGPNAIRLDHVTVHKDYVTIAFTGLKAGTVFGHIMLSFFCWSVLCLVFVLGVLVYYGAENPTKDTNVELLNASFPGTNIKITDPALAHVLNLCGHLILSATTVVIITMGPAECFREGRNTYELATYKGLFLAQTQLERNFIRSLWILASDKFPLAITSKGYFKMTRGMLIAFLMCVFTYFIFLVQSRNQIQSEEEGNSTTTTSTMATTAIMSSTTEIMSSTTTVATTV